MKLSISNIGWTAEQDSQIYELMKKYGFTGLEIAPTRIFSETPYDKLVEARVWAADLRRDYGFTVPSMQSIWFGRQENLFGTNEERQRLVDYSKKAIDFAAIINCKNLVFGCPRNRTMIEGADEQLGMEFFKKIADYAESKGTVIGMEANPTIYNTNYINDTKSAFNLIEKVNSRGFLLNLDVGTMIHNGESLDIIKDKVKLINHVHISEPGLRTVEERKLHHELRKLLVDENYNRFISIEMGKSEDIRQIEAVIRYVKGVFC